MFGAVHNFLSAQSRARVAIGAIILIGVIGTTDYITGFELAFSIFYLIPVATASWYVGKRFGFTVCILCAATWVVVDYTSGHRYSHAAMPVWNTGVRLGFFTIVAYLLTTLRDAYVFQESLAQQDSLTGITNSRTFKERYAILAPLAARHGRPMVVGYIDLDDFKGINDSLGHHVGDRVLKTVAAELARRLRTSDVVGRLGGDEFALLLAETDLAGAQSVFADVRERLLAVVEQHRWPIGFSIGVAVFHSPPEKSDDAIRYADKLMYKVKGTGKNSIVFEEYRDGIGGA